MLSRDVYIADLINEIARDNWTLTHDPTPAPSPEFYLDRITKNHEEVTRLRECDNDRSDRKT
jgi:hypothetical protein